MTITIGATTMFSGNTHGDIIEGPYDVNDKRSHFFGVQGETEIEDEPKGRDLTVDCWLSGYASGQAMQNDLDQLRPNKTGQRDVTLSISGTSTIDRSYTNCTYKGYTKDPRGIRHNAVDDTYRLRVTLHFRQHKGFT